MRDSMDRRGFLGRSLAAAMALQVVGRSAVAATDREKLLAKVDPRLIPPRVPIADESNAYVALRRLAARVTDEPPYDPLAEDELEYDQAFSIAKPNAARDERFGRWADENPGVVTELAAALDRPQCEFPREPWSDTGVENITQMRRLARLLLVLARRARSQGECLEAAGILELGITAFRRLRLAGGLYVDQLVSSACEYNSLWPELAELAGDARWQEDLLRGVLDRLPRDSESKAGIARSLQWEFYYYLLPEMEKMSPFDVESLQTLFPYVDDAKLRQVAALVEDHPNALDPEATVALFSQRYVRILDDLDLSWSAYRARESDDAFAELQAWPAEIGLGFFAGNERAEISDARLASARAALRKVDNPVGKKLVQDCAIDSPATRALAARQQATQDGMRVILALGIYERQRGRLPETLPALVEARLLAAVPSDPFGEGPLSYSAEERAVWSVGQSGRVSPQADGEEEYEVETLLWRLPE